VIAEINLLLAATKNPKSYSRVVGSKPKLKQWVIEWGEKNHTRSFSESLFCIHHNLTPPQCECGELRLFNTFVLGYRRFCGIRCSYKASHQSATMRAHWGDNPDSKKQMLEKKAVTLTERYGVDNPRLIPASVDKIKATNVQRYGVEFALTSQVVMQKIKHTLQQNHGVDYPFQSAEIRQKGKNTFEENHGFTNDMRIARQAFRDGNQGLNPFQVPLIQDAITDTMHQRYGVAHPSNCPTIRQRAIDTLLQNHGVNNPAQLHIDKELYAILNSPKEFTELLMTMSLRDICEKYTVNRSLIYRYHTLYELDIIKKPVRSAYEEDIARILTDLGLVFQRNTTALCAPLQVDFYLPEHKLAIEFNGLYWHSERSGKKDARYHQLKTIACRNKGVQLITIFEDEWLTRPQVIINHLTNLCGLTTQVIGARKLTITSCKFTAEVKDFLNRNHIQGAPPVASYVMAARYCDTLVAVFLLRKVDSHTQEIVRYCVDTQYSVPGAFSRFVARCKKIDGLEKLTTIADLRWSYGRLYNTTGFRLASEIKPDYAYTDYHTREHKFNFRKNNIARRFGIDITGKTERQLTTELGYDRIWDCGKQKWVYDIIRAA
jgi:very-short-patch-repair endonuclease